MRDTVIEATLEKGGFQYVLQPEVPLSDIQITDAARQNIRPVGIDQDVVLQYAIAMEDGAEFPPVVLYRKKVGFGVLNGLHRVTAAPIAHKQTVPAYITTLEESADARAIEVLQRMLNTLNGLNYGKEERIQHAIRIHEVLGYTVSDAARMMGLKPQMLVSRLGAISAKKRAAGLDLVISNETAETSLNELNRLKNPAIFKAAVLIAQSARLTTEQVRAMSQEIREAVNDEQATAVIEAWRTKMDAVIKETMGGKYQGPTSPARRAMLYLDRLERNVKVENFNPLTLPERKNVIAAIDGAIKRLQRIRAQIANSSTFKVTVSPKKRRAG